MARNIPSAAEAAQNWQTGFGAAGAKWAAGINSVTTPPGQAAAAAADRYLAGVQANVAKFQRNVANVSLAQWKDVSVSKGQGRLASGAQAGMAKYQAKIGAVLDAIKTINAGLPPRGTIEQNIARSSQFQREMHAQFSGGA